MLDTNNGHIHAHVMQVMVNFTTTEFCILCLFNFKVDACIICRYTKTAADPGIAPTFNYTTLQALLECVPLIPCAYSSGALHWFFCMLDRVKCMDVQLTAQACSALLHQVAAHYREKANHFHSLLKTR